MTEHSRKNVIWPWLSGLTVLFVASVVTPRGWESIARRESVGKLLAAHWQAPSSDTVAPVMVAQATPSPTYVEPQPPVANRTVITSLPPVTTLSPTASVSNATDVSTAEVSKLNAPITESAPAVTAVESPAAAQPMTSVPVSSRRPSSAPALVPAQVVSAEPQTPAEQTPAVESLAAAQPSAQDEHPSLVSRPRHEPQADEFLPSESQAAPCLSQTDAASEPWCAQPDVLLANLDRLSAKPPVADWARQTGECVRELAAQPNGGTPRAQELFLQLETLSTGLEARLESVEDPALVQETRLAGYGLRMRLDIWKHVPSVEAEVAQIDPLDRVDPAQLDQCLVAVAEQITNRPGGEAWRHYIEYDTLKQLSRAHDHIDPSEQRRLVQRVLSRFNHRSLTPAQRQVLSSAPMADLQHQLRYWGAEPFETRQLLADLERFDQTGLPSDARKVAEGIRRVSYCPTDEAQELARTLETYCRNSNFRMSISAELLNRLLPQQQPRNMYVHDNMLGYPTRGTSTTHTELGIRLVPDPHHIRLALVARGDIYSDTNTYSGPVTLRTLADSEYVAAQEILLNLDGILLEPVHVEADTNPRLQDVKTDFDRVPILRGLIKNIAIRKNEEAQPQARMLAERKIEREVRQQIRSELGPKVARASHKLKNNFLEPLHDMDIHPEVIESQTTPDRFTMRIRMAGEEQLAGHSPRPRAPEGCLASFQVHQSMINNLCEALDLAGKTRSLPELQTELAERLNWDREIPVDPKTEDLFITFAEQDPIHVSCEDGRMEITLAVDELRKGYDSWKDFVIRVAYKPDTSTGRYVLVRDGTVRLSGDRLGARAQLALRGIFSKAFPKDRGFQVLPQSLAENPNLADVGITQFDIRDGWIGISLGTKNPIDLHSQAMR